MTVLLDARPTGLDALFRAGDAFVVQFTWPSSLAGRTFAATLDGQALTVEVVGSSMTVTASEAQTAAVDDSAPFVLVETTGSDRAIVAGKWAVSDRAAASQTATVTVLEDTVEVTVSVIESGSYEAVQALEDRVDATETDIVALNALDVELDSRLDVLEAHNSAPIATDQGLLAWAFDPAHSSGGSTLTNGTVWLAKVHLRRAVTVSNILWWQTSAFTSPTAGQCFVGLYDSTGALLRSAAIEGQLTGTGLKTTAITPVNLPAGWVWCTILGNASAAGAIARSGSGGVPGSNTAHNAGLAAAVSRAAIAATVQTSLPASFTPSGLTATGAMFWFGLT